MFRTSLYLPTTLHQRLRITSRQEGKTLSRLVGELLDRALAAQEEGRLHHLYAGLQRQGGFGEKGVTDASATMNDTLYGEQGAWKGEGE